MLSTAQDSAHGDPRLALSILGILGSAALVAFLLRRRPQVTIPAYLVAGALIGPHALGIVGDSDGVESIASLATILLMFTIGLHFNVGSAAGGLAPAALISVVAAVICTGAWRARLPGACPNKA